MSARARWGRRLLVVALAIAAGSISAPAAPAATSSGYGLSGADLVRLDPKQAGLSFGVVFGPTGADHRNRVARAVAQSTNFGLVGTAITADGCDGSEAAVQPEDLPQQMAADSRQPGSDQPAVTTEGPITQSVMAAPRPFARATSRLGDLTLPGVVTVTGASNVSTSGLTDDGIRQATARVEVGEVALGGGLIKLEGLVWEGIHRGDRDPEGHFTVDAASLAGLPLDVDDVGDLHATVNAALAPLGLTVVWPEVRVVEDTVYVKPLTIAVVANEQRDLLAKTVLGGLQPIREELFGALIEADCGNSSYILVLDLLLGSVTGSGSMEVSLGGVNAATGVVDQFAFAPLPPAGTPTPTVTAPAGPVASPAPGPAPVPAAPAAAPAPSEVVPELAPTPIVRVEPPADGALAVALGCLGLGAVLVEGDRRKMRRAEVAARATEAVGT